MDAEGQEGLSVFLDFITFLQIFGVWAIIVSVTIRLLNKYRAKKISFKFKAIFIIVTGLIALVIFSFVTDTQPYDGPIDSIIYKEFNERHRKQDSLWIAEGYPDSTIVEVTSIDTNRNGIYIWLNQKEVFVRKHSTNYNSQRQEDSVTMSIVRSWTQSNKSDHENIIEK